jgi:uncharacterized membrane protein YqjE
LQQPSSPESMSSKEIVRELVSDTSLLLQRQVKLARLEAAQQAQREKKAVTLLGVAGVLANAGAILLLVVVAVTIGLALNALWAGGLIVGGVLLLAAAVVGAIGWKRREKQALPRTRHELEEELTWAKSLTT